LRTVHCRILFEIALNGARSWRNLFELNTNRLLLPLRSLILSRVCYLSPPLIPRYSLRVHVGKIVRQKPSVTPEDRSVVRLNARNDDASSMLLAICDGRTGKCAIHTGRSALGSDNLLNVVLIRSCNDQHSTCSKAKSAVGNFDADKEQRQENGAGDWQ
jgi:hypothetical protein